MEATVCRSALQEVNIPQLVGDERGTVFVPMYNWQAFLIPFSKAVKGIKQYHHFSLSYQAQGVVMATTHAEGPTQILPVLVGDAGAVPNDPPSRVQSPGLSAYRQWYLFNRIHDFCTDDTKDIMCPKPTVPQPGPAPPTRQIATPLPQGEADPEGGGDAPARGPGRGRGCGRGRGRGRGRCTKGIRLRIIIYTGGGRGGNEERKWTLHHHPGPGPDHQPDHQPNHQPDHQGHRRVVRGMAAVGVWAEVVAVQGDILPPDRLSFIIALVTF